MALQLLPIGWSSRRFALARDGEHVAELRLSWLREGGEIVIDGEPHDLRRQGLLTGSYELALHGALVARASKTSALRHRFTVVHDGRHYELRKAAWWGRRFELRDGGGPVGEVRPTSWFTRRAAVTLPDELSLSAQVFVTALVVLMWKRDAAAGAGGGA